MVAKHYLTKFRIFSIRMKSLRLLSSILSGGIFPQGERKNTPLPLAGEELGERGLL